LSVAKGTKPFRLAPWPRDIWLQLEEAWVVAPICRFTEFEVLAPGSGFPTDIGKLPAVAAVPVAVRWVGEIKVVAIGADESSTCAPGTKLLPVMARVKAPVPVLEGVMPAMVGVGFSRVTALEALAEEDAALVAVMVMPFGEGREVGAL
jgi:hypothetical protein